MRLKSSSWAMPLLVSIVVACDDSGGSRETIAQTRDSAGITVVENVRPAWAAGQEWMLGEQPILTIGMAEGPEEYQLYRVYGSARLSDGRIVVANAGTSELRFFDANGRFLHAAGQRGSGPGEFRTLRYVFVLADDSLLAWDSSSRRASIFDAQGTFQRSYSPAPYADSPFFVSIIAPLADGSMIAGAFRFRSAQSAVELGLSRDTIALVHLDANGELISEAGRYPGTEWYTTSEYPRVDVPFARSSIVAAFGDVFFFGDNATYQISVHESDGTLKRIVRKEHVLLDVTDDMVQDQKREWIEGIPVERRQEVAQMFVDVEGPPTLPAFSAINVDALGNLWVQEYRVSREEPLRWTVFDPDGVMLGTISIPDRLVVHEIGHDYVLGRWRDDEDVEYLHMYTLTKP